MELKYDRCILRTMRRYRNCGTKFSKAVSLEFDSSSRIDTYLKRNPKMSTVAQFHDDIIGTVLCGHDGRRGTIYHVAISEEHRGKGIAKRMVERSISSP